jgi:hypothetical protein
MLRLRGLISKPSRELLAPLVEQPNRFARLAGRLWRGGVIVRVGQVISQRLNPAQFIIKTLL